MMSETKRFTFAEVGKESSKSKPLLIIHNNVYDVTDFLNEHPGGEEVLLEQAGLNATESFEDVGHSSDAREMMEKYKIGEIVELEKKPQPPKEKPSWELDDSDNSRSWASWIIPVTLAFAATVIYRFFFAK